MYRCSTLLLALSVVMAQGAQPAKPNVLTPQEIADGWIMLFDGETTFGWLTNGPVRVDGGQMILGGLAGMAWGIRRASRGRQGLIPAAVGGVLVGIGFAVLVQELGYYPLSTQWLPGINFDGADPGVVFKNVASPAPTTVIAPRYANPERKCPVFLFR